MLRRRDEVSSTFSDVWYRVADLRPRVSPHANFIRQERAASAAAATYIIEEPASGNFYRLTESAYFFIALLDGRRTVGEAWDACNAQLGDDAPTQKECIDLLSQLQLFGLLAGDGPLTPDMVLERKRQARKKKLDQRTGKWMFFNIPLYNPEPLLERYKNVCRFLFSRWGLAIWSVAVVAGLWMVLLRWGDLAEALDLASLLSPDSLILLAVMFMIIRIVHEFGHAAACKAFGGRVTELGVILIAYVLPLPYCDATAAWRFPSVRQRVIVSMGGIYFEVFLAALAAILWSVTDGDTYPTVKTLTYNVMLISGVSTFVFNLNPLLRYDGYYVLSDVMAAPNLAQRARESWVYLLVRYVFGSRVIRPPVIRDGREAALLIAFGALSTPYRLFVMLAIVLIVTQKYPGLGLVIGAVMLCIWAGWPLLKGIGGLAASPLLVGHRFRAVMTVVGAVVVAGILLGIVPAPAGAYADGVVMPASRQPIRVEQPGFLGPLLVQPGDAVEAGQVIVRLSNPKLEADLRSVQARVEAARAEVELTAAEGKPDAEAIAVIALENELAELEHLRDKVEGLNVRAPGAGRFVVADGAAVDLRNSEGRFARSGLMLGEVASLDDLVVRIAVPDKQASHIFGRGRRDDQIRVGVRVRGDAGRLVKTSITRRVERATHDLLAESLATTAGGGITPDPTAREGGRSLEPHMLVEVSPQLTPRTWQPGLRSRARFALPAQPLLIQWERKVRQYLDGRLG